jgi:peroxiredoxin
MTASLHSNGGNVGLKTGDRAPDFELPAVTGTERHKFKLSDLRGKKNVVLAFYALDWSPT